MSWLFSQALVEAYSAENCSDGEPCAQLNVMDTPHPFWRNVKTMEFSSLFLFGVTSAHLTESRGEALLTSYLADFHARTSVPQVKAQASTATAPVCGRTWHALSTKFDRNTSSWKIAHSLFPEDLPESSVILPNWGLMRDGELWELTTSVLHTSAIDAGLLPTPTATNARQGINSKAGGTSNGKPLLPMAAMTWPTPTASMMTAADMEQAKYHSSKRPDYQSAKRLATPTARDWRSGKASQATMARNSRPLSEQIGGQLNPTWVEWLMGWPLGWTDLKPLVMVK